MTYMIRLHVCKHDKDRKGVRVKRVTKQPTPTNGQEYSVVDD